MPGVADFFPCKSARDMCFDTVWCYGLSLVVGEKIWNAMAGKVALLLGCNLTAVLS